MSDNQQTVALVGFPNSGKSTIFNLLSGGRRKVSNYSGITVDCAYGDLKSNDKHDQKIKIVDLPGTYNLAPNSIDEAVTTSFLLGLNQNKYHLVALVLDMDRLESSLSLSLAMKDLIGDRLVLVINKNDNKKFTEDHKNQLTKVTGLKVLSMSARFQNADALDIFLRENTQKSEVKLLKDIGLSEKSNEYLKIENGTVNVDLDFTQEDILKSIGNYHKEARVIIQDIFVEESSNVQLTKRIDKVLIHPFFGSLIFIAIFYFIFDSIYTWAGPLMDLIDGSIGDLSSYVGQALPQGLFNSLITDGIIAGVGGVLIFLPQIM
ncbi:MAG: ferrous iron transport protein B, partial [Thermoproteota archaeon]